MLRAITTLLLPKASDTTNYQFLAFPQWATSVVHFSFPSKVSITPKVNALTDIGPSSKLSLCVWDSPLLALKVYNVIELATFLFEGTARISKFLWNSTCARRRSTRSWKGTEQSLAASPSMKWHTSAERQQNRNQWWWSTLALKHSIGAQTSLSWSLLNPLHFTNSSMQTRFALLSNSNHFPKEMLLIRRLCSWKVHKEI